VKAIVLAIFFFIFSVSLASAHAAENSKAEDLPKFYAISLGNNCYPALFLRACGFRSATYPFDWMITNNFEGLKKAIEEEFMHFLDPEYLTYDEKTQTLYNSRYGFSSDHFWNRDPVKYQMNKDDFVNYLFIIEEIFNRRTQRFLNALKSGVPIYFLRKKAPDYLDLLVFRDFLFSKYPQIKLTLIIFDEIDNPYPEDPSIQYYKIDNIDYLPDQISLLGFEGDPRWSPILKSIEWLKGL